MTRDSTKPPESLLQAIARDLSPVKPSPLPSRLALRMAPLAILLSSLILLPVGLRHDYGVLGPAPDVGRFCCAVRARHRAHFGLPPRESTPASKLPKKIVYFVAGTTALVVLGHYVAYILDQPNDSEAGS